MSTSTKVFNGLKKFIQETEPCSSVRLDRGVWEFYVEVPEAYHLYTGHKVCTQQFPPEIADRASAEKAAAPFMSEYQTLLAAAWLRKASSGRRVSRQVSVPSTEKKIKGVYLIKHTNKWSADVYVCGERRNLSHYANEEMGIIAKRVGEAILNGNNGVDEYGAPLAAAFVKKTEDAFNTMSMFSVSELRAKIKEGSKAQRAALLKPIYNWVRFTTYAEYKALVPPPIPPAAPPVAPAAVSRPIPTNSVLRELEEPETGQKVVLLKNEEEKTAFEKFLAEQRAQKALRSLSDSRCYSG